MHTEKQPHNSSTNIHHHQQFIIHSLIYYSANACTTEALCLVLSTAKRVKLN